MRRMFSEKQLNEKYVKVIPAPKSTTLTDDQIAQITSGMHVEGSFLGYPNPMFFPAEESSNAWTGIFQSGVYVRVYGINKTSKVIALVASTVGVVALQSIAQINGKTLPVHPSNTGTFTLKMVDGSLAWVEDI